MWTVQVRSTINVEMGLLHRSIRVQVHTHSRARASRGAWSVVASGCASSIADVIGTFLGRLPIHAVRTVDARLPTAVTAAMADLSKRA